MEANIQFRKNVNDKYLFNGKLNLNDPKSFKGKVSNMDNVALFKVCRAVSKSNIGDPCVLYTEETEELVVF